MKHALTIAGSDSSGGAGIQADLKAFSALGVYGMSVITAVTAQNTQGVTGVQEITPDMVAAQIDAIYTDINVDGVKIGMVSSAEIIKVIAERLHTYEADKVVIDTVMVSKSGCHLLKKEAKDSLKKHLLPRAYVVTPNIYEAEVLVDSKISNIEEMKLAAKEIHQLGAKFVIVKGGHLDDETCADVLFDGDEYHLFNSKRINTQHTHGTGCTFSAALAAFLAQGYDVYESTSKAKEYITEAIRHSFAVGKGVGPTHHFYKYY
ncbi:bifunctional hydroxymethylpyrimidine kinase/phosphomethylpyrimidine kinase [Desulfuribacillus alkaliarsenatis]|uniref:Hydroxymethylpyrimidine/phosphomethylpyrimidine kinase n=1 Tax=Desulfuribacillus alkaliarsenatis TaxID=766136 RepID=A0A1E5G068_9FIRM|nr:bifunctional hydroxymethylpyrimidine kinase/phosphomethylpyrimidine kinase [Desulfuribacillus alkaliarsenatis]OEF96180.1 bifunctional hydroxymethylpyrimidine kinase/phosphomethylpyrimidine kinase [Desulfuribacillus alkaliarsenatis]